MRLAYIITLYKQPDQFRRLLEAIWHPDDVFALHLDAKADEGTRKAFEAVAAGRPNVWFVEPVSVTWGGFAICEAEWRCLQLLLERGGAWTHVMNLTGQDLPLKARQEIGEDLARRPGSSYLQAIPVAELPAHFRRRAHWLCWERPTRVLRLPIPNLPPRGFRNDWYGSGFFVLDRALCEWLSGSPLVPKARRHFRRTWHPHEHWLQALVMAGPFRGTIVSDHRRFIRWRRGSGNPLVLTMADLPEMERSDAFFARKFDATVDAEVMEAVTRRVKAAMAA